MLVKTNNVRAVILCIFTVCSYIQSSAQPDWHELSGPYGATADALSKTSDGKLFLCTWSGLYRSVNDSPWEKIFGENADIFIDEDDKIYVTRSDKLYISVDAGETFTKRSDLPSATCRVRKLSNGKLILFAVWSPSCLLFISEDDGLTWSKQYTFPAYYLSHLQMEVYDDRIFVSTRSIEGLLVSDNEGTTFAQKNTGVGSNSIHSLVRTSTGAILRQSGEGIYRSDDDCENWSLVPSPADGQLFGQLAVNAEDEILFFDYGQGKTYRLNPSGSEWEVTNSNFPFKSHSVNAIVTVNNDIYVLFSLLGVFRSSPDGSAIEAANDGLLSMSPIRVEIDGDGGILAGSSTGISKYSDGSWTTTHNSVTGERISGWELFSLGNNRLYLDPSFYSDDNGTTWMNASLPADFTRMTIGPDQRMYAYNLAGPPLFFTSTDLGETWEEKTITDLPVLGLREKPLAATADYVYLTGSRGDTDYEIWKIDPVASTAELIYSTTGWIDQILAKDGSLYIVENWKVYRTDDEGETWKYLPIPSGAVDIGFKFLGNTLWVGSLTGGIQYSSDKGETWTAMNYPTDDYNLRPTSFAVDDEGYVYAGLINVGVIKSDLPILDPDNSSRVNSPPTISAIGDVEVTGARETVTFTIDDVDNMLSELELTATSSNQALVRDVTFKFYGTDSERILAFTVEPFSGESVITISVSDGLAVATRSFKVRSELITSVFETRFDDVVRMYPNPADDLLNVSLTGLTPPHQVSLLDVTGRVVATTLESENHFQFPIKNSPAGIYFLQVISRNKRFTSVRVMRK